MCWTTVLLYLRLKEHSEDASPSQGEPGVLCAGGTCVPVSKTLQSVDCDSPGTGLQLFPLSSDNFEVTFEGLLEAIFSVSRLEIREEFHPVGHKQFNSYQLDGEGKLKRAYQLEEKSNVNIIPSMIMVHSLVGCHMPLWREMVLARMITEGVSQAGTGRKTPCALNS